MELTMPDVPGSCHHYETPQTPASHRGAKKIPCQVFMQIDMKEPRVDTWLPGANRNL